VNGLPAQVYLWLLAGAGTVIAAGATFIVFLGSLLIKEHIKSDEEFKQHVLEALKDFEERFHKYGNKVNEIVTRLRWEDEDKSKGE